MTCALACGGDKETTEVTPTGPIVGVLDLAVSLRSAGTAPSDFHEVEVSSAAVNVGGHQVLALADGIVAAADRQADQLPKLSAALGKPARSRLLLAVGSAVSYDTAALVLSTAQAAGVKSVAFKVRPPGGGSTTGFLSIDAFSVRPKSKSDEEVAIPGAPARPWSDFAGKWDEVQSACRASPTGNCAYKSEKVAEGGQLKIVLYAAGQGSNIGFYRVGAPPPTAAEAPAEPDAKATKADKSKKKKKKKPELIDGVKAPADPLKELEEAPPATEALFQFRAQEAVTKPSALSSTMQPVCGSSPCGVVVQGEKSTLFVRVLALLGASFPDGSPAPTVAFELP
jgi:biopolymer transport protein ExbD